MIRVLYIAATTPYDTVPHAGGQTLNYYISNLAADHRFDVSLVSFCEENVLARTNFKEKNIHFYPIVRTYNIKNTIRNILSINSKVNPWYKYADMMTWNASDLLMRRLMDIKSQGYQPQIIIMEWTQIVLQVNEIKNLFPLAKIVASEHDVSFLGARRKVKFETNGLIKAYRNIQSRNLYKRELRALNNCDLVYTHNQKDNELLKQEGISSQKRRVLVPYYHQSQLERNCSNKDILFYGNMKRMENEQAAIWFIENVMPLLSDISVRFVIVGGGPSAKLKSYENNRIKVLGYVENIDPIFSEAMCFVAPLSLGAGIKVKVLEAMYTGIPVLTNTIGIEGIPAIDGKDYIRCAEPVEYKDAIYKLFRGKITINGKHAIENNFSISSSIIDYKETLATLGYINK